MDEYETARKTLDQAGWDVDHIITHCCPSSVQDTFSRGLYQRDALTDFFDEIQECCKFQYWFFGHYHTVIIDDIYSVNSAAIITQLNYTFDGGLKCDGNAIR